MLKNILQHSKKDNKMVPIGQRLRDKRIERKISIEDAATALKIKSQFLDAIEKGDYKKLPSPAYAQGFVRNYADYLGLPKVQTAALFKRDFDEKKATKVLPDGISRTKEFKTRRINLRTAVILILIFLSFLSFLLYQTRSSFIAPYLVINSPKDGTEVPKVISVTGMTDNTATVTINNEPVFVTSNGSFVKKLTFFPGKSTIVIKAKNRSGKETTKIESVIVRP
jgi:cytoskeletal protein RodZ